VVLKPKPPLHTTLASYMEFGPRMKQPTAMKGLFRQPKFQQHVFRAFCHRVRTIRNSRLFSFILVRTLRSGLHYIKSPNQRNKIIKFKNLNLTAVQNLNQV
jgi:hypothetical protein